MSNDRRAPFVARIHFGTRLRTMFAAWNTPSGWLRTWRLLSLLALLLCFSSLARAAEDCTVSSTPVAFGAYDPVEQIAPLDGSGQVTVDCRGSGLSFVASLSPGATGSYAQRQMTAGAETLGYNLYLDAARTIVFGDGNGGTQTLQCTTGVTASGCTGSNPGGANRRAAWPIYGRIPAGQNVAAGLYSDTLQVTIVF